MAAQRPDSPDPKGPSEGTGPFQVLTNNLPQYHMEVPVRHHSGTTSEIYMQIMGK